MSISAISVINFISLRNSHNISTANLASALQLKSSASITNIEKGKAAPSYELLERYVDIFGVTSDWLMGRTNQIYTQDSLLTAEKRLFAQLQDVDPNGKHFQFSPLYLDETKRSEYYSHKVRGNIIFLLNIQYIPLIINLLESEKYNQNAQSFMDRLLNRIIYHNVEDYYENKFNKKSRQQLELLSQLLNRKLLVAPFDPEEYLKQQQQNK